MADCFSPQTIDFLWGLRFNNNRDWFALHKPEYEAHLLTPIRTLGSAVYDTFNDEYPGLGLRLHISRIYRDARRLHGRGPFKENLWFSIEQPAEDHSARPGFYFTIGPDHWGYGMGFYDARAAVMQAWRADIDRNPVRAQALAERFAAQDTFTLSGARYARSKGGPGGLLDDWYNRRIVSLEFEATPDERLFDPALAGRMLEGFRFLLPYYEWLQSIAVRTDSDGRDDRPDTQ